MAGDTCEATEVHTRNVEAWYGTLSGPGVDFDHLELTDMITASLGNHIATEPGRDTRVTADITDWVNDAVTDVDWIFGIPESRDAESALHDALAAAAPAGGAVAFDAPQDRGVQTYEIAVWSTFDCGDPPQVTDHTAFANVHYYELNATYTEATPSPTPSAGPSSTVSPTPAPTPTPTGSPSLVQGNVDCDPAGATAVDALKELRYVAQVGYTQTEPCPNIGEEVASLWGDVDCDDDIDAVDALKVLRFVAALGYAQDEPCTDIGAPEN